MMTPGLHVGWRSVSGRLARWSKDDEGTPAIGHMPTGRGCVRVSPSSESVPLMWGGTRVATVRVVHDGFGIRIRGRREIPRRRAVMLRGMRLSGTWRWHDDKLSVVSIDVVHAPGYALRGA